MIQPTLMSHGLDQPAAAVLLDSISIQPDTVLLLDTFFHILIFHGETVASWRKAGYHEQEGYENLATLLEEPQIDAQVRLLRSRLTSQLKLIFRCICRTFSSTGSPCPDTSTATSTARRPASSSPSSTHPRPT